MSGMITAGLMSSATDEWATPQWLYNILYHEFHFTLDVCATHENAKCKRYYTAEDDGLSKEWNGVCWMNPPYGRNIAAWMRKAAHETTSTVVALVPARTDTEWWHENVARKADEIRFIRGRLSFGESKQGAPFPSAIVIFGHRSAGLQRVFHVDYRRMNR